MKSDLLTNKQNETAIFACGCFWCLEAQFKHLKGVETIVPGFTGGDVANPSYDEVCTGKTGHAEACQIHFNPQLISYSELLRAFFQAHDPTQLNKQGNDIGTQYRSALFYLNDSQKAAIEDCLKVLKKHHVYKKPIVTQVCPANIFYSAEDYHKNYYNLHGENPYCSIVIQPKVKKFINYLFDNNLQLEGSQVFK